MKVRLYILRHGEAERHSHQDESRELTARGRAEVAATADYLATKGACPLIVASPLVRAQQTAAIVAGRLGVSRIETCKSMAPEGSVRGAVKFLESLGQEEVLLASHMPLVSRLSTWLVDGVEDESYPLPTAGLRVLTLELMLPGMAAVTDEYFPVIRHA